MRDGGSAVDEPEEAALAPAPGSVRRPVDLAEGWRIDVVESGITFEEAERVEYDVFVALGFCAESREHRATEYDGWRDRSRFHVALTPDGTIGGVLRVTFDTYSDLPVGKFERDVGYPDDPVVEIASLALPAAWRRHAGVAEALYRSMWADAIRLRARGVVAIGEQWLLDLLNGYDFGFAQLGGSRWYMGGECFPMGTSLSHVARRLSANQPDFWAWLVSELDVRERPLITFADERDAVIDLTRAPSERAKEGLRPSNPAL